MFFDAVTVLYCKYTLKAHLKLYFCFLPIPISASHCERQKLNQLKLHVKSCSWLWSWNTSC